MTKTVANATLLVMQRQFTATVYIVQENRVLLLLHPKLKKWLPPGGHVEENELPPDCAKREAFEETGLHVALVPDEHVWVKRWNAESFERPWFCLLENIPEHGSQKAHQHMDFIYVGRVTSGQIEEKHLELNPIRWFSLDEVQALISDNEIFAETQEVIRYILSESLSLTK